MPGPQLALLLALLAVGCSGLPTSGLYSFGEQWADQRLPAADEVASMEISLRTPFVYYGHTYSSLFVNMNGFVSFLTEIPSFFNIQFPLDYPIIAAFYSDVDTTSTGTVWYRETSDPATISRLKAELATYFEAAADFTPTGVFIATWDGVGGHRLRPHKTNTYQLILATDGHESYVVVLYADRGLQWLRGRGKNPSLSDALAQAGFISGDGRMDLLRGSGKDQVRNLDRWSNVNEPGVWVYRVGQLATTENIAGPDLVIDTATEDQSCSVGGLVCHSTASCVDYSPGFCCKCPASNLGNGINCVRGDEPLRVTGKVSGNLNGVILEEADLHSYILTAEGRTYTAVSRLPTNQGYDMQTLVPIATGISWLFAKPSEGVSNGFTLTGGLMNRTVTLDFPQTGHSASVQQIFMGLDVFENVEVKTYISGTLPTIPIGSKIEMGPFVEEYTRVTRGQIRARSNRVFRLAGQQLDTPFDVETTIDFDECAWMPPSDHTGTLRLKVSDNIFIQYDAPERIVRFALSSTIGPLTDEDPCLRGREQCGDHSECVVDGDSFRCICDHGYEQVYDPSVESAVCVDNDECATGRHQCAEHAQCDNNPGSFTCTCHPDYEGDGYRCQPLASCATAGCDLHAECRMYGGHPSCFCPIHWEGDGFFCLPIQDSYGPIDEPFGGNINCGTDVCGQHSQCQFDEVENRMRCTCMEGYSGDGHNCVPTGDRISCHIADNCSSYATCQQETPGVFVCVCLAGFTGDGYTCHLDTDFNRIDHNFPTENIGPIHIDQIPLFILGGNYSHLPVVFGENPYGNANIPPYQVDPQISHGGSILYGGETHHGEVNQGYDYQPHDPNLEGVYPVDNVIGGGNRFNNEDLGLAHSVYVPDVPAPYVPPQLPQESLQPYQPHQEGGILGAVEMQCSLGTCFCPPGYKFNQFIAKCEPQSLTDYIGSAAAAGDPGAGAPQPYCGQAKCTCPAGYTYNEHANSCDADMAGAGRPQPVCDGDRLPCQCPSGYYYQYPENTCEMIDAVPSVEGDTRGGHPSLHYGGGTVDGAGRPQPVCDGDRLPCQCPGGYYYQYPENTCEMIDDIPSVEGDTRGGYPSLLHPAFPPNIAGIAGIFGLPNYPEYHGGAIDVEARPLPECVGNRLPCICPQGFYFQYPQRTCEPSGDPSYNYGIMGGGQPQVPFPGYVGANPFGRQPPEGYPLQPEARPVPECVGNRLPCICPQGFYFQFPQRTCEPSGDPSYNYGIMGGGHLPGYVGPNIFGRQPPEGYPLQLSCNEHDVCHDYAACIYEADIGIHLCRCNPGFAGDGFTCIRQDFSCDQVNICHVNAQCIHDDLEMRSVCVCLTGYVGDGMVCNPEDECNNAEDCAINAQCGFDGLTQRFRCTCHQGYTGDGRTCVPAPDAGCNVVSYCHHNADCIYDPVALTHRCQCRQGYEGDGVICNEIQLNCNVLQNCGQHSQCLELAPRDYRCVCRQGYTGDGYYCQPTYSCQQDPTMCHEQASCQPDSASNLGFSCMCERGYIGDGYTCVEAPTFESNLLLLNQGVSVLRMPVDRNAVGGGGYPITVNSYMSAVGSDVDCFAGRYYWTDVRTSTIRSSNYDGTERRPVVSPGTIGSPEDVAVDWISRNIYWTDSGNDEIAAASINEGLRRTIITGDLVNPRGIAVHPGRGLLFWSDWNREGPKIESSGLDGSDRRVLVDTNIELPNSLVVDFETSTLCWADAGTHKIECIGVTGRERRTVVTGPQYPFGLTLHQHHFYYTDWNDGRVHVVNKYTGAEEPSRPPPPGGSGRLYGIVGVPSSCPPVSNACQVDRGRCPPDMLCLPNSYGGRTCACPANPPAAGEQYQGCTDIAN